MLVSCEAVSIEIHVEGERMVSTFHLRRRPLPIILKGVHADGEIVLAEGGTLWTKTLPATDFYLTYDEAEFVRKNLLNGEEEGRLSIQFRRGPTQVLVENELRYAVIAFLDAPMPAELIEMLVEEEA